jgi:hypothetical protein
VQSVTYGNGASTVYTYDNARRLTVIDHRRSSGSTFLKLTYAYTVDDLPDALTEHSGAVQTGFTDFSYDTRHRLIGEVRTNQFNAVVYNRVYQYDQGGNRTKKIDPTNETEVTYHFDYEDPAVYGSDNNRLMYYDTVSTANQMSTPISSTFYYYNESGNVTRVVTKQVSLSIYTSTRLEYAKNGQTVAYVLGELWQADGGDPDSCPDNFQMNYAREFRYDSGRARYLNRQLDTDALEQNPPVFSVVSETWTDYDGDESYGDFTVSGGFVSNARSFELGVATVDPWQPSTGSLTKYYHPDLIGTTRSMSTAAFPAELQKRRGGGHPG